MGAISFIDKLPADIRDEFNQLAVSKNFKDYAFLAFWLTEKGYDTSKSAVHRYITDNKESIMAARERDSERPSAEMKLRALELSVAVNQGADFEAMKAGAEQILNWVYER